MIEACDLRKNYGDVEALAGVSFSVKAGEVIGLLGPNGAGKTTLMKILTGYLQPSDGSAKVGGYDVLTETEQVQELIGYLPENAPLYPELSVQSYLQMMADLRGISRQQQTGYLSDAIRAVGLEDKITRPIGTLSKGYRQRVGLAQAILHKPKLLILDEPTNGLDPTQIGEVRRLIKTLAHNSTIMVSTHILSEVEATCDRALVIIRGKLMADARLADLAVTANADLTLAEVSNEIAVKKELAGISDVKSVTVLDRRDGRTSFRVHAATAQDLCPQIYRIAKDHNWALTELKRDVRTLEAVFNELTTGQGGAA
ncbi:MAG: ATP-binding cassette domain-containing protein [Deltaproteobacteria bacterium]